MSDRTFGHKKASTSTFSNPSLVSPHTPTLANPVRSFGLPTNNVIQTATEESTNLQEAQTADEQSLLSEAIQQRSFGHDISRIALRRPQAKLTVGEPGDKYEQEADWMANQVMRMVVPDKLNAPSVQPVQDSLQRKCAACDEEEKVQTKPSIQTATDGGLQAGDNIESRLNSSKGGGNSLPDEVRSFMEPRFGADFSQVRVHTGSDAVQMNRDLNAQAFTHKQDVYFGDGKVPAKDTLTAHELTHVVQQSSQPHAHRSNENYNQLTSNSSEVHGQSANNIIHRYTTPDCNTSESSLIATAIATAQSNLRTVITQLGIRPLTADIGNALWLYFRSSSPTTATTVSTNLNRILTRIGSLSYECENDCSENQMGYTRLGTMITGIGNIHLCLNNLGSNANEIATTIIHEVAHYELIADDSAGYYGNDCEESETTVRAGTNTRLSLADSYSCIVQNWMNGNSTDRANARGDLTGANIAGISQIPAGAIDLNGTSRRIPLFAMKLTRGPLAQVTGVSYRWVLRDPQDRSYQMTDTSGSSLFEFKPALESILAVINLPTRNLLKQRRITSGRVLCRATSPVFGERLFEIPVTFQ